MEQQRAQNYMRLIALVLLLLLSFAAFSRMRYIGLGPNQVFDVYRHAFCTPTACYQIPSVSSPLPVAPTPQ
jgi:hypothetical protein